MVIQKLKIFLNISGLKSFQRHGIVSFLRNIELANHTGYPLGIEKLTNELPSKCLLILELLKNIRDVGYIVFREDQNMGSGRPMFEGGPNIRSTCVLDDNNAFDDETPFFPETLFSSNCVPESALPPGPQCSGNVEFNGVLDNVPQIMTIMIERLGIRPEYLSMEHQGNQNRRSRKKFSQQQASQISRKVIARLLTNVGFEAASELPVEVFSQLLSCQFLN